MTRFSRYIGIDYSGAKTPDESLPGLRIYSSVSGQEPTEDSPPPSPKKYWTRRGAAQWVADTLKQKIPTIVGIDHGFSFPIKYFDRYKLHHKWDSFLEDFREHWPTDEHHMYVEFIREGLYGKGKAREGDRRWRRLTEIRARASKGVFFFDVQGSVAKSTHAGLPWLLFLKKKFGKAVHFWPFDGWLPKPGVHVIAEIYPTIWNRRYPQGDRTNDQQDAYSACRWMRETDQSGEMPLYFEPLIESNERPIAEIEGWILGVL